MRFHDKLSVPDPKQQEMNLACAIAVESSDLISAARALVIFVSDVRSNVIAERIDMLAFVQVSACPASRRQRAGAEPDPARLDVWAIWC